MNFPTSAIAWTPFWAIVLASRGTTAAGIHLMILIAIDTMIFCKAFIKSKKGFTISIYFLDILLAATPTIEEKITNPTIFKLTIASTGLEGIRAFNVSTIFFTSLICFPPWATTVFTVSTFPTLKIIPRASPTATATATITKETTRVLLTKEPRFASSFILMITWIIDTITNGITSILTKDINPLPNKLYQRVVSLTNVSSIGSLGNPATNCITSPKIKPITVAVITLAEKLNFCLGNLLITIIIAIKAIKKIIVFTSLIIKNCWKNTLFMLKISLLYFIY